MLLANYSWKIPLLLASSIILVACGKRGPLVYPDLIELPPPTSVEARAVGNGVSLSFVIPASSLPPNDPKYLAEIRVYRQDLPISQSFCRDCKDSMPLFATLYLDSLRSAERRGNMVFYWDNNVQPEYNYLYRIALQTREGVTGTQSPPVVVSMVKPFPAPILSVESTPTEAILYISGERPAQDVFAGYAIYRGIKGDQRSLTPFLPAPVKEATYTDFTLKTGVKYVYSVRSVYKNGQGEVAESLLSNEVEAERSKGE